MGNVLKKGWWKKFMNCVSKDKSVPKTEVDEVTYVKSKETLLEEEMEKATLSLKRLGGVTFEKSVATPKRARNKGKFVADNKSTPNIKEARGERKKPKQRRTQNKRKK